uniref:Uncharacterized protein n=1 Tax=Triticum urartu TaxID=4572 RepID=A0A8R7U7W4_TRIUA
TAKPPPPFASSTAGPLPPSVARPSSPSSAAAPRPGLHPPPSPAHPLPPPAVRLQPVLFSTAASVSSPPPPLAVAGARRLCLPTTCVRYTLPTTRKGISFCNESLTNLSVEDRHILSLNMAYVHR